MIRVQSARSEDVKMYCEKNKKEMMIIFVAEIGSMSGLKVQ